MVGIILAAGLGTRLYPATKVINKNILSLYDKPAIYYSLSIMMKLDIYEIIIVCNKHEKDIYIKLFGKGNSIGLNIKYVCQEMPEGIVDGVLRCKTYAQGRDLVLLLGDNFFYGQNFIETMINAIKSNNGATMFGLLRDYEQVITTIEFNSNDEPVYLERLSAPKRKYISPGIFVYDKHLFEYLEKIDIEKCEWVEVNKKYLSLNMLKVIKFDPGMFWFDIGMPDTRLETEMLISLIQKEEGNYVGCVEEVAYRKKLIGKQDLEKLIDEIKECDYKRHLEYILLTDNSIDGGG